MMMMKKKKACMFSLLSSRRNGELSLVRRARSLRTRILPRLMSTIEIDRSFRVTRHRSRGAVCSMDMARKYLLVGNSDGSIASYDVSNSKISFFVKRRTSNSNPTHHKNMVSCVQWYPVDPGIFVSSGFDGTVKVWDTQSQKVVTNFGDFGLNKGIDSVSMSPTSFSCTIAVAARGSHAVHLCDVISGTQIMTLDQGGHMEDVKCVAWSPRVRFMCVSVCVCVCVWIKRQQLQTSSHSLFENNNRCHIFSHQVVLMVVSLYGILVVQVVGDVCNLWIRPRQCGHPRLPPPHRRVLRNEFDRH